MPLPPPGADALAHSQRLREYLESEIERAGGWLGFARYMELALYAPGLGYYSGGSTKFGAQGDFVTAPGLSPLFGLTVARQIAEILAASGPEIIEVGAGNGSLAADLLQGLAGLDAAPRRYAILELSAELRERQKMTLEARVPELAPRVEWIDAPPACFSGLVLANEVLDAMPVHLVAWREDGLFERGVTIASGGEFAWEERPAQGAVREAAERLPVHAPYVSEINLAARAWITEWSRVIERGALLLIDYGFPRREYYHPQRSLGTLMCHYRHHAHAEPFHLPGLTDITAHVDFTAIAEAAHEAGLAVLGYTSQAEFLLNCGIVEAMSAYAPGSADYMRLAAGVQKLLSPSEMGELFKVIALGANLRMPLLGFRRGDRVHAL